MIEERYYKRKFLNKDEGIALIEVTGEQYSESVSLYVVLSDCNRQISLDFYFENEEVRQERLDKMDLLIAELKEARKFIKKTKLKKIERKDI